VSRERVFGWDFLRGLTALAVAGYHLLYWLDLAALHAFGSYGVYLFFVLSGASLAYTYAGRLEPGARAFGEFLWVRYLRLAPLYLLLMAIVLPWKLRAGWSTELATNIALNVTFLFGLTDPALSAFLIGGWSLGIEAIFYLLFPLLLRTALQPLAGWLVFGALVLLQALWIANTIGGPAGYTTAAAVAYHQVPAFGAYFMGGCLLGVARLRVPSGPDRPWGVVALLLAGFGLLYVLNPVRQGDELTGWRGALFASLCFGLVHLAGRLRWSGRAPRWRDWGERVSARLGDATYGLYLIHPVVFFALQFVVLPRAGLGNAAQWPVGARVALVVAVMGASFVLALASERWFERPLRNWSRRALRRAPARAATAA